MAGVFRTDRLAELDLSIFGTEVRAGCEERVLYAGHTLRVVRIRTAVWAEEILDFWYLVRKLHLVVAVVKRHTHREGSEDKRPQP